MCNGCTGAGPLILLLVFTVCCKKLFKIIFVHACRLQVLVVEAAVKEIVLVFEELMAFYSSFCVGFIMADQRDMAQVLVGIWRVFRSRALFEKCFARSKHRLQNRPSRYASILPCFQGLWRWIVRGVLRRFHSRVLDLLQAVAEAPGAHMGITGFLCRAPVYSNRSR